jgi:PAS domain S-box-containing protein
MRPRRPVSWQDDRASAAGRARPGRAPDPGPAAAVVGPGLRQALAAAGDGAFAIGPDGLIVLWNRAAERILGFAEREVLGRPCCEVFAGEDESGNRLCYRGCHIMSLVGLGEAVRDFDMRARSKAGRPLWLNVTTLAIPDGRSGPVAVHLFRDVTGAKELLGLVRDRRSPPPEAATTLTRREIEILRLVATGAGTRAMAEQLHVSPATVRNHVQNLLGKLGAHSRLEAVAIATRQRLL